VNQLYHVGIYFSDSTTDETDKIIFSLKGDTCSDETPVWDGSKCTVATPIEKSVELPIEEGQQVFLTFNVAPNTGSITLSYEANNSLDFNLWARYAATPIPSDSYHTDKGPLTIPSPHIGTWYAMIQIKPSLAGKDVKQSLVTFNLTKSICTTDNELGPYCNDSVTKIPKINSIFNKITVSPGQWFYYQVIATPSRGMRVSVQPSSTDQVEVYASLNQLPTYNADIRGCNAQRCDPVIVIKLDNGTLSSNQTWYIGVTSKNPTNFGIWFESLCPPKCDDPYGSCTETGACLCNSDYTGIDCQDNNGWQAQYVVLIIIAALVVSTAIIGLIAWAYMRKKKSHAYEQIRS